MEYKSCFILMPFSKAEDLEKHDLDYIYTHILKKAVEEFEVGGKRYFQIVERFESKVGSIISGIVKNLNCAELVIADLTGLNPNVMYELGVRHALKRGTIIISQHLDRLPSDLRDYLTVGYTYSQKTTEQVAHYDTFKADIHKTIREIISTDKYDSPVLDYLLQKQRFRDEEEVEKLLENAIVYNALKGECIDLEVFVEDVKKEDYTKSEHEYIFQLFNFKLGNISIALNELRILYSKSGLYSRITNAKTIITELVKLFSMSDYLNSIIGLDESAAQVYDKKDVKSCLKKEIINLFTLHKDEEGLDYMTIEDLFKMNGVLDKELLEPLRDYFENRAKQLGVEKEVEQILDME